MICLDVHTHSIASGHGTTNTVADLAKSAASCGLSILGISDHGPATLAAGTPSYFRSLSMSPKVRCGVSMLYGVELNLLDISGSVDLDYSILKGLDYAIISMHPQNIRPGSKRDNTLTYINGMSHPKVKIIGHPDDVRYPVDYKELVYQAKEKGVIIEINNASLLPNGYRGNTLDNNMEILRWCKEYEEPILLSSDSHGARLVGHVELAEDLVKGCDFPDWLVLNYDANKFLSFFTSRL